MDDVFFKSVLPARGSGGLDDSSLALPAEPSPGSSARVNPSARNLRVQQQVQLTLARRARKSVSNGGVHLQKNSVKSFDASDGLSNMKINGPSFTNHSLSSDHVRRPSRRVEVSPPQSPEHPRSRFNYSTLRYGTFTHPGPSHLHRMGTLLDHSFRSNSFYRYAHSEVPRVTRPQASTAELGSFGRTSFRQTAAPQPAFSSAAFQQSGDFRTLWCDDQTFVKQEKHMAQGQSRDMMRGSGRPDEGLSWLAQIKREGQGLRRLNSYPPSGRQHGGGHGEADGSRNAHSADVNTQFYDTAVSCILRWFFFFFSPFVADFSHRKPENKPPEMTLERAVNLLTQDNEETLICAASHIQNQCFKSADAKRMVYYLRGIGKLLQLLDSDNEEVQCVAAGALRNIVYQSSENKMEVKENNGLASILTALKSSRDVETRRELTGLLWNLSSHDLLKERLSREALPVVTKAVLVPSSGISEGENPKDELLADADVFYYATGCLRNLSSAGPDGRKAMRDCENLIDSLVYYIRGAIADYKTDDKIYFYKSALKSTENCVCILHNLSYQIAAELPEKYTKGLRESRQSLAPQPKAVGCFSSRSAKITELPLVVNMNPVNSFELKIRCSSKPVSLQHLERQCPLLEENANPKGIEWLWSAITIRMYLSLMACSARHYTQEAAIGALQNITAGNGAMTEAIAFTIVQRENGLQHVKKMLVEGESDVKRTAISLIKNLSHCQELHPEIVRQVLPEVTAMLPNDDTGTDLPTDVTGSLCHILINLSQYNFQNVRAIVNQGALPKIINISSKDNGLVCVHRPHTSLQNQGRTFNFSCLDFYIHYMCTYRIQIKKNNFHFEYPSYGPTRAGQAACLLLHTMWRHSELHGAYKKVGSCSFNTSQYNMFLINCCVFVNHLGFFHISGGSIQNLSFFSPLALFSYVLSYSGIGIKLRMVNQ
ncbi:hypothetical protein L3Q82_009438, partial [Scortum barcoo]